MGASAAALNAETLNAPVHCQKDIATTSPRILKLISSGFTRLSMSQSTLSDALLWGDQLSCLSKVTRNATWRTESSDHWKQSPLAGPLAKEVQTVGVNPMENVPSEVIVNARKDTLGQLV